jgi:hypothetical protein
MLSEFTSFVVVPVVVVPLVVVAVVVVVELFIVVCLRFDWRLDDQSIEEDGAGVWNICCGFVFVVVEFCVALIYNLKNTAT